MKRFFSLFLFVALCIISTNAQDKIDINNRVVLVAAHNFDEIIVNGNITIECRFRPELHRYVVYNTTKETTQRIDCRNEGNQLIIDGDTDNDMVASRIVVFCNDSLKALIMNGSGNILVKDVPRLKRLHLIQNANGAIKIDNLQAHLLSMVNNGDGKILVRNVEARRLATVNNGNGEIKAKTLKAFNGAFIINGNSDMNFNDLLVRKASFTTNSTGSFTLQGKVKELSLISNNAGNINASKLAFKNLSNNKANGSGVITIKND